MVSVKDGIVAKGNEGSVDRRQETETLWRTYGRYTQTEVRTDLTGSPRSQIQCTSAIHRHDSKLYQ